MSRDCREQYTISTRSLDSTIFFERSNCHSCRYTRGMDDFADKHRFNRTRQATTQANSLFGSTGEVEETYVGGLEQNRCPGKRGKAPAGSVVKVDSAEVRHRDTKQVAIWVVLDTPSDSLVEVAWGHAEPGTQVLAGEAKGSSLLCGAGCAQEAVRHGLSEYKWDQVRNTGMESSWAVLRGGPRGACQTMSKGHLHRHASELQGSHILCPNGTIVQMAELVWRLEGWTISGMELIAIGQCAKSDKVAA